MARDGDRSSGGTLFTQTSVDTYGPVLQRDADLQPGNLRQQSQTDRTNTTFRLAASDTSGSQRKFVSAATRPWLRSVRTKLLVMLVLLSLPLLVISLLQLASYRQNLIEQSNTLARIETAAAASSLASWLETHSGADSTIPDVSTAEAEEIYSRIQKRTHAIPDAAAAVFDSGGRAIVNPQHPGPFPGTVQTRSGSALIKWSDGVTRMTSAERISPWNWTVAIGASASQVPARG